MHPISPAPSASPARPPESTRRPHGPLRLATLLRRPLITMRAVAVWRPALATAVLLGVVAVQPAAGAVAKEARKRCSAGQERVFLLKRGKTVTIRRKGRGRPVCVRRLGAAPATPPRIDPLTSRLVPRSVRRHLRRRPVARLLRDPVLDRVLQPRAAAARRTEVRPIERHEAEPGKTVWGQMRSTYPDDGEVGQGQENEATVETDAATLDPKVPKGQATLRRQKHVWESAFAQKCPDHDGRIALDGSFGEKTGITIDDRDRRIVESMSWGQTFRGTGQVGDNARARDVSMRVETMHEVAVKIEPKGGGPVRVERRRVRGVVDVVRAPMRGDDYGFEVTDVRLTGVAGWKPNDVIDAIVFHYGLAVGAVYDARRAATKAEHFFYTRFECVELEVAPVSDLAYETGGTETVGVEARSTVDRRLVEGGTVVPTTKLMSCPGVVFPVNPTLPGARFNLIDNAYGWNHEQQRNAPCFMAEALTRRGRSDGRGYDWPLPEKPEPDFPWHYKVLDASFEQNTTAAKPGGLCADFGGTSGSRRFSGTFASSQPSSVQRQSSGALDGHIVSHTHAVWTDHYLKGCRRSGDYWVACSTRAPDKAPGNGGLWTVQVGVRAPSADAETAQLTWSLSNPSVGFVDASHDECNVSEIVGGLRYEDLLQDVPLAKLASKEPQTYTFSLSRRFDRTLSGQPATIDGTWSYTMTIQRVDEDGRPLP